MKAITLWQPYASAIAAGLKRVETRHWPTRYRGPIAIHAAKRESCHGDLPCGWRVRMAEHWARLGHGPDVWGRLPRGAVVAVARLVDCREMDEAWIAEQGDAELLHGCWESGRWGWVLEGVHAVTPVPCTGAQGLWELGEVTAKVEARRCRVGTVCLETDHQQVLDLGVV